MRRASKALLKQVEAARRKYALEVDGLKAELCLLKRQTERQRRESDLAGVTAAAAKRAALEATERLESLQAQLQAARRQLDDAGRCVHCRTCCCEAHGWRKQLQVQQQMQQRLQLS